MNGDLAAVENRVGRVVERLESGKTVPKRDRGLAKLYQQASSAESATAANGSATGARYTLKPDTRVQS